jgi:hypothetical protein
MRPWHKADPTLLEKTIAEVQAEFPELHFYPEGSRVIVRGSFPVVENGEVLDRYAVEIELLADYPDSIPVVREAGGRIPRIADYHMNAKGEACLFLPDERWRIYPEGTTFLSFLKGPVRNFFIGQSLFRLTGEWPFGQRGHGAEGIREYYGELLGTDDVPVIRAYLEYLSRPVLKGHWPCPCGGGKRLRDCHRKSLEELRTKIPTSVAMRSLEYVRRAISGETVVSKGRTSQYSEGANR